MATTPTTPPIEEITTIDLKGTGIFDELMQANKLYLEEEYRLGRIKGTDYSKVYLGSLQAIMQQSVVYALGWREAFNKGELLAAQIEKINAEILLLQQEQSNSIIKGELLAAQRDKEVLTKDLIIAQTWAERAKTVEDITVTEPPTVVAGIIGKQKTKIDSEVDLLGQKKNTELAQTVDLVESVPVTGVIGKQKDLFTAQTEGFTRKAEQALAKIMADSFSIRRTTDEELIAPGGLTDGDIKDVMNEAKVGIGAPPARD